MTPKFPDNPTSASLVQFLREGGDRTLVDPFMSQDMRDLRWAQFVRERGWNQPREEAARA